MFWRQFILLIWGEGRFYFFSQAVQVAEGHALSSDRERHGPSENQARIPPDDAKTSVFLEISLKKDNQQSRITQARSNNGVSFYTTYLFTNLFQVHNKVTYTNLVAFQKVKMDDE